MTSKLILPKPTNLLVPERRIFIPSGAPRERQRGFIRLSPSVGLWNRVFTAKGVEFNGSNVHLSRTSAFTSASDHDHGLISFWYRVDVDADRYVISSDRGAGTSYQMTAFRAASSDAMTFNWNGISAGTPDEKASWAAGANSASVSANWKHVITSYSKSGSSLTLHTYVNDSSSHVFIHNNGSTIQFRGDDDKWWVGSLSGGAFFDGGLAELAWYILSSPVDLSVEAQRRKFYSAQGRPVDLGPRGEWPFGELPVFYQSVRGGEDPSRFAVNRSGRGDFTFNGTPVLTSTDPAA